MIIDKYKFFNSNIPPPSFGTCLFDMDWNVFFAFEYLETIWASIHPGLMTLHMFT